MIRMTGLVDLQSLKEEETPAPEASDAVESGESLNERSKLAMKLKKLKEMELTPDQEQKVNELMAQMEELTAKQKQLDVDKDGKIEADDLAKLRANKADEIVLESDDHEVGMANNLLDDIIKNATELKGKMGQEEKDIPAWIQDHISQSQNFISQANVNYHEYDKPEDVASPQDMEPMNEAAPEGWEKTIKAIKKHKEIDNPWALANWMKKKGYQPKKES
jgi:outer membrane murein-binding lipoprotein Lpp